MNTNIIRVWDDPEPAPDLTADYVLGRRWMRQAPCAYAPNPDAWFPDSAADPAAAEAMAICAYRCPVWEECAAYAIATEQSDGIAAGVLLSGPSRLDQNANQLRDKLAGSDIRPDLKAVFDQKADARRKRRQTTSHARRAKLGAPVQLRDLLDECAPKPPAAERECA